MRRRFHLGQRGRFQFRPHGLVLARVSWRCIPLYKRGEVDGRRQNGERGARTEGSGGAKKCEQKQAGRYCAWGCFRSFASARRRRRRPPVSGWRRRLRRTTSRPPRKRPPARLRVTPFTRLTGSIRATIQVHVRGPRLHRDLCAGISAERHGDRAACELLLAPRLSRRAARWGGPWRNGLRSPLLSRSPPACRMLSLRQRLSSRRPRRDRRFRCAAACANPTNVRPLVRRDPRYYARPVHYRPYSYGVPAPSCSATARSGELLAGESLHQQHGRLCAGLAVPRYLS